MARPHLSRCEMEVLQAVWKSKEATLGEIHAAVESKDRTMDYSTVQTYIRRLETKGYVRSRRVGRTKLYRPRIRPGQVRSEAIQDLLSRLFDGQPMPLVRHLLAESDLSDRDIAELKQLLGDSEAP